MNMDEHLEIMKSFCENEGDDVAYDPSLDRIEGTGWFVETDNDGRENIIKVGVRYSGWIDNSLDFDNFKNILDIASNTLLERGVPIVIRIEHIKGRDSVYSVITIPVSDEQWYHKARAFLLGGKMITDLVIKASDLSLYMALKDIIRRLKVHNVVKAEH